MLLSTAFSFHYSVFVILPLGVTVNFKVTTASLKKKQHMCIINNARGENCDKTQRNWVLLNHFYQCLPYAAYSLKKICIKMFKVNCVVWARSDIKFSWIMFVIYCISDIRFDTDTRTVHRHNRFPDVISCSEYVWSFSVQPSFSPEVCLKCSPWEAFSPLY